MAPRTVTAYRQQIADVMLAALDDLDHWKVEYVPLPGGWVPVGRICYEVMFRMEKRDAQGNGSWPGPQTVRRVVSELASQGKVQVKPFYMSLGVRLPPETVEHEIHLTRDEVAVALREQAEWEQRQGRARA